MGRGCSIGCGSIRHPFGSATPSTTDEDTFKLYGKENPWSIMVILASNGEMSARMWANAGPGVGAEMIVPKDPILWEKWWGRDEKGHVPVQGTTREEWDAEYDACVEVDKTPSMWEGWPDGEVVQPAKSFEGGKGLRYFLPDDEGETDGPALVGYSGRPADYVYCAQEALCFNVKTEKWVDPDDVPEKHLVLIPWGPELR